MELLVKLEGADSVGETADLKGWIQRERIPSITGITQREKPPRAGEQGPTLLAILGVVLGAKATVELVRSIHRWIETRKRKITITIERGDQKVIVDCDNPPDIDKLLERVEVLVNG